MQNENGEIPRTRASVALCRCGVSAIRPFCDGTHKLVSFTTNPAPQSEPPPPRYQP
ncbi:CDGSH iron-sulfur domain-containing protein [Cryobacterium sp. MDB1-18-1]|uniref:CDGSH iron-sulfur domain-containing protein n=1 Tax=Cryobacterium sp. MDB1-18-1 TaxID=1259168 RepID=UPI0010695D14|nr:CDGSH iron-sulfur domain-containing protein [Cryobacterium sp. MDB1-18-1]